MITPFLSNVIDSKSFSKEGHVFSMATKAQQNWPGLETSGIAVLNGANPLGRAITLILGHVLVLSYLEIQHQ